MQQIIEYAPIILIVIGFMMRNKLFVTPEQLLNAINESKKAVNFDLDKKYVSAEQMQIERKSLMAEVEQRFLSIVAFREFERRMDDNFKTIERRFSDSTKRFDKVDNGIEHIKDMLIRK